MWRFAFIAIALAEYLHKTLKRHGNRKFPYPVLMAGLGEFQAHNSSLKPQNPLTRAGSAEHGVGGESGIRTHD